MLYRVQVDDGNMSHPYDIALVEAESEAEATKEALSCLGGDGDSEYDAETTPYKGGLLLKEGVTLEWLT